MDYTAADEVVVQRPNERPYVWTLDEIGGMSTQAVLNALDWMIGVKREIYHDAFVLIAGTAMVQDQTVDLFSAGLGQNGYTWNTQAGYKKREFHTNLFDNGKFEWGKAAIILAVECEFKAPPAKPATVGTSNNVGLVTDSADHASQPSGYNPVQFQEAMMVQNAWGFYRGANAREEHGRLADIPSSSGTSGFAGGGSTYCLVQNSMGGFSVLLRKPKIIHSQEEFFVRLTAQSALSIPIDCKGFIRLDTIEIPRVQVPMDAVRSNGRPYYGA
jgi:hypothetical protein